MKTVPLRAGTTANSLENEDDCPGWRCWIIERAGEPLFALISTGRWYRAGHEVIVGDGWRIRSSWHCRPFRVEGFADEDGAANIVWSMVLVWAAPAAFGTAALREHLGRRRQRGHFTRAAWRSVGRASGATLRPGTASSSGEVRPSAGGLNSARTTSARQAPRSSSARTGRAGRPSTGVTARA